MKYQKEKPKTKTENYFTCNGNKKDKIPRNKINKGSENLHMLLKVIEKGTKKLKTILCGLKNQCS